MVSQWKDFVFLYPSLNHMFVNFCFNSWSSCSYLLFNCSIESFSSTCTSSMYPLVMADLCKLSNLISNLLFSWKMFPKDSLFHIFTFFVINSIFCWDLYIRDPLGGVNSSHHCLNCSWKYGWDIQNNSKRKDILKCLPILPHVTLIDQWSDLVASITKVDNSPTATRVVLEIKNLFSRQDNSLSPSFCYSMWRDYYLFSHLPDLGYWLVPQT